MTRKSNPNLENFYQTDESSGQLADLLKMFPDKKKSEIIRDAIDRHHKELTGGA